MLFSPCFHKVVSGGKKNKIKLEYAAFNVLKLKCIVVIFRCSQADEMVFEIQL